MRVVDRDVDAEVVAAGTRIVEPAVQHVRAVQRRDRPAVVAVGVVEAEVLGERARDDRLRRSRRRRSLGTTGLPRRVNASRVGATCSRCTRGGGAGAEPADRGA